MVTGKQSWRAIFCYTQALEHTKSNNTVRVWDIEPILWKPSRAFCATGRLQIDLCTWVCMYVFVGAHETHTQSCGRSMGRRGSTHPFSVLPSVGQHLLQGPHWQGLLQHKVTNTQVWRNMLQDGKEGNRRRRKREGSKEKRMKEWRWRGKETLVGFSPGYKNNMPKVYSP